MREQSNSLVWRRFCAAGLTSLLLSAPSFTSASALQPEGASQRAYLAGNGFLNRGLYELAISEYETFLKASPDHENAPTARYGMGLAQFRLGLFEEAVATLAPLEEADTFEFAADVALVLGQAHMALGQYAQASAALKRVAEKSPDHPSADDAAALYAEALYRDGRHDEAAAACARFPRSHPQSVHLERVALFHGLSLMSGDEYEGASEVFKGLLDAHPGGQFQSQATLLRAQCLQRTGAAASALRLFERLVRGGQAAQTPDALLGIALIAHTNGDLDRAASVLDTLLGDHGDSLPAVEGALLRGRVAFEQGETDRARRMLEDAAKLPAARADEIEYWLAKCDLRDGEHARSAARLARTIEAHPGSALLPEMRYDRAVAIYRDGAHADAAGALAAFRAEHPGHDLYADALHLEASIAHQLERYEESQALLADFTRRFPAHDQAAFAGFMMAENDYLSDKIEPAADRYERFLRDHPDDEQADKARFRLGSARFRLEQDERAEDALERVVNGRRTQETFRPALRMLGDIAFRRGDWRKAQTRFSEFVGFGLDQPAADDALIKLGLSMQRLGSDADALKQYDRLLESFDESPHRLQAVFERGRALAAIGRTDDARVALERVVELDAESRFAPYALNQLGAIAMDSGDHDAAGARFALAARRAPAAGEGAEQVHATATFNLGLAQSLAGDHAAAVKTFDALLRRHEDDARAPRARARRAIALSRSGAVEEAIAAIEAAEERDLGELQAALAHQLIYEKAWALREAGRTDEAAQTHRRLLEASPAADLRASALVELAKIEADAQRHEEAARLLTEFLSLASSEPGAVPAELVEVATHRLGAAEFRRERYAQAAAAFETLLSDFPQSSLVASASLMSGEANFTLGRFETAATRFARVVEEFPRDSGRESAMLRLGECHAKLQQWDDSERVFSAFLGEFADSELWHQAQFGVGFARENRGGRGGLDAAIEAYSVVTARHQGPTAARAQFQIGECLFAMGEHTEAARELLKVDILYAYPEWSAAALYEAGRVFTALGQPAEARKHFQAVIDRYPESDWARMAGAARGGGR